MEIPQYLNIYIFLFYIGKIHGNDGLPQLLLQNTNMFVEATVQSRC